MYNQRELFNKNKCTFNNYKIINILLRNLFFKKKREKKKTTKS